MCVFVCQVFGGRGMGIRVRSWSSQVGYIYQLLIFYSTCTLIYTIYIKCFPSIFHSIRFDSNFYCQIFFRKMLFFFTLSLKYLVNSFTHEYSFHLFQIPIVHVDFKILKGSWVAATKNLSGTFIYFKPSKSVKMETKG